MKKCLVFITLVSGLALAGGAYAAGAGDHDHGDDHSGAHQESHGSHDMGHGSQEMFLVKKAVDGYDVSFHIMKAKPGKEMGGSHDFMIKVEKNGKALTNIAMNTKVIYPNGKSETKKTMIMGDWLMAGYDLGHPGKHQLMILFKTADGAKHKAGVYYSVE